MHIYYIYTMLWVGTVSYCINVSDSQAICTPKYLYIYIYIYAVFVLTVYIGITSKCMEIFFIFIFTQFIKVVKEQHF